MSVHKEITKRATVFRVRFRDPKTGANRSITFDDRAEAERFDGEMLESKAAARRAARARRTRAAATAAKRDARGARF